MSYQSPLSKVKGLGASGHGSSHWWWQRLTALALIPLSLWFVFSIVNHLGDDQATFAAWVAEPCVALLLVLYTLFMFVHAQMGLTVIIEDYVHSEPVKLTCLMLNKAVMFLAGTAMLFAVLRIAL